MDRFSFLNAAHLEFIGDLYDQYVQYPDSIEPSWKAFFQGYDFANATYDGEPLFAPAPNKGNQTTQARVNPAVVSQVPDNVQKEFKVINLIDAYRTRGHLFTKTNPVRARRTFEPSLDIKNFGLTDADLGLTFNAGEILGIGGPITLREIIGHLENMYCESIGIEYMYVREPQRINWIQNWLNQNLNQPKLSKEEKERVLEKLNEATAFENFMHTKYVGQKRFSVEGNESLIPALDTLINRSADHGVQEVIVGMAHRGRLNVLANIFGKSYSQIFSEFEGKAFDTDLMAGDVKYHMGSSNQIKALNGKEIKINLAPNPSHLETVDAVVEGITRAKAEEDYKDDYSKIIPILIHGDAAVAGQGIVYEVVQMAGLDGYKTGGTVHVVVNNQIGFTTNYLDARTSTYCTDVAKVTLSPVMHVNSDDVEAVVHAFRFAADYRAEFGSDVFIDLLGYRKYGHNEGDEPKFTQPKLYNVISKHPNPREIYKEQLLKEGVIGEEIVKQKEAEFKALLEKNFEASKEIERNHIFPFMPEEWEGFEIADDAKVFEQANTAYDEAKLKEIAKAVSTVPEGKKLIKKVSRLIEGRGKMIEEDKIDWGLGEALAFGSILTDGRNVRVSGEDVERGTFSHRHAVVKTEDTEEEIILLNHINDEQGQLRIYNSLLSEYAVLGFDYGYAMANPKALTIWEAQFGDFVNGAQIVIDQYISAAEDKWKLQNGLVMLLPHGYEGQGAEHSSARLERFLQMCAGNNMFVANITTPANFFHALRRQVVTDYRKPLVVMSPKSLLRHPSAVSSLADFTNGGFQEIIEDVTVDAKKVKKVVFCSGKIYYDLDKKRQELGDKETAIIRLEQLYPLNEEKVDTIISKFGDAKLVWAQEEPENMGAWMYILRKLRKYPFDVVSPAESAATAPGSSKRWAAIYEEVINKVFN
ncbi:2-oxoglutarate dehydrogenase E1 component [Empedobacter stercoris]|uniref:oxoglutarate dehydrogenase (succinyl-transferring) n=1 Tax=Empedobacter stercoris TaxID=1628248 RepID=A0ABX1WKY6_9FLAO|nr:MULTISPECIES: 2-oxoglutarate dehydrogenase E1 component [Empedobacter]MCA4776263.1 2-oxoglutarate dehydrogenase E1 component [Empedobacter stercoris]MCA4782078.1 2-oxoglutarate dehydrogenase E1 component [Empedobacter stercoris]MCA4808580.1 2-oxoglutarate dehydrogenase E1 component [Empedobacter stercoris]MDM1542059.1 2-oxoglutarate dehydrogenase E1 component [Empedobacter sp. 189-2]NOJ75334.1 2-oxoglutarate dehydrogenase E1 component [Empedobacter stercoris]